MRIVEADSVQVPTCLHFVVDELTECENVVSVAALPPGNWLVQANVTVDASGNGTFGDLRRCGLVQGPVSNEAKRLDHDVFRGCQGRVPHRRPREGHAGRRGDHPNSATRIGVRCLEEPTTTAIVEDVKLTALEVANVVGP